ncbi:hypothetical protein [Nonomuraea sp. NPDC049480]|uniref:hypothetical protein n=1 Tax=Nonomuraea sp. NPDC049480 TaxID=3364353 RepID=UPI0037955D73
MTKTQALAADLPADLVSVIYFCEACGCKHTFGRDYMAETGVYPDTCPNPDCAAPLDQDDRVTRDDKDTHETLEAKKRDLFAKRGRALPAARKPDDPKDVRDRRIRNLESELRKLRQAPESPADGMQAGDGR